MGFDVLKIRNKNTLGRIQNLKSLKNKYTNNNKYYRIYKNISQI